MVGFWTLLGLYLAVSCLSTQAAPLAPEAQGTFPPGALGCTARQDGQAQEQAADGLEARHAQRWSQECPSVPRLAQALVPAAEAEATAARLTEGGPETAAREEEEEEEKEGRIPEGLVQEEAREEEARGQVTLTTTSTTTTTTITTTTTTTTSMAAAGSVATQSSVEERRSSSALVTSTPSTAAEQQVPWQRPDRLADRHRDAAEPGDRVAEEEAEEEEEEGEGEGVAHFLHSVSVTVSPATDGKRGRAAAYAATAAAAVATVPPSAKPAMPTAAPPSEGPSGRETDGWGETQMAQQSGDPAQAGGQATRGQRSGSHAHTPGTPRGATPEGHWGGYEGQWEATLTRAPQGMLTPPDSESGRGVVATAASAPPSSSVQHGLLSPSLQPGDSTSSVERMSEEAGAGATSPASGPDWASQLPIFTPRSDAPVAETWTETVSLQGEGIGVLSSSQEVGMEPAMSSEDLPLIFEPFDEASPEGGTATAPPGGSVLASQPPAPAELATGTLMEADLGRVVTMDTDRALSDIPPPGAAEWPSPWQTSGVEMAEAAEPSRWPVSTVYPRAPADHTGADITQNPGRTPPTISATLSASVTQQRPMATVTKAALFPAARPKSGLEELESEEEEDEENEDTEDSEEEEEESDEDLTDGPAPAPASTRPPYSLIPPPPVWVQRNQGLARSWVELIREKAGYVSGMLAPVGIGIAGALLIVGALYSIRMIHRKRRNSFKHQRRKQTREVRTGQDQAMLLADSSEDEF
ncbi:armadillo-like helical domain-containing protein 4 isoform X2 [Alosa alosa]|uniref:armadillo-like helical domain-containing protein 4 isoform X2 n=1 Tax=Alosa alosa TaxID=278164 RepID=UPI0020150598|nr:armadillo-like helical domain-containing protein 4 isoform X2 [Alosa alosa]